METEPEASHLGGQTRESGISQSKGKLRFVDFAFVGIGGALGASARTLVGEVFGSASEFVMLGINVTGAFLLGMLVAVLAGRHPRVQLLVGTGLLGGFTTYSLLALQVSELMLDGALMLAAWYGLGTVVLGFIASLAGVGCGWAVRHRMRQHRSLRR